MSAPCCLHRTTGARLCRGREASLREANEPGGKSNDYSGLEAPVPTVMLPPSKIKGKIG